MEQTTIARQMTSFYKTAYDSSVSAMSTLQEQTEKMVSLSLDQSPWLPEQSKALVNAWVTAYKRGCDSLKATADAQYKKFEAMSNPGE